MFNSRNLLIGLVAASVSFSVCDNWMAIAQSSNSQFQSILLAQSFDRSQVIEIGRLSSGEKILKISRQLMSRNIFREALKRPLRPTPNMRYTSDGEPIIYDGNQPRLFLFDGNKFTFVGYDINSIFEFKVGNQIYWATLCAYNARSCSGILVSEPNFVNTKSAKGFKNRLSVLGLRKDNTQEGWFYAETTNGNGLTTTQATYLVNLSLPITSPNKSVVACEVSRYTNLRRGGRSPVINNPKCQNGKQVSSVFTTIPSAPKSSTPVKSTDEIARYITNDNIEKAIAFYRYPETQKD